MKLKKFTLGLTLAFALALPASGLKVTVDSASKVEAAEVAQCEKTTTTVTFKAGGNISVTFTNLTSETKNDLALDLNDALGVAFGNGSVKPILVDGVAKKIKKSGSTMLIGDGTKYEPLVEYVNKTVTTETTVSWTTNTKVASYIKSFAGAKSYQYAIVLEDELKITNVSKSSIRINGKNYKYVIKNGNLVFDGDLTDLFAPLVSAKAVATTAEGHDIKKVDKVLATPYKMGTKEYYECSKCGKLYSDAALTKEIKAPIKTSTFSKSSGLQKSKNGTNADGKWYVVKNWVVDKTYTGFCKNENGNWYIENGKLDFARKDIVKSKIDGVEGWYFVSSGEFKKVTSIEKNANGWFYIKDGKVDFSFTGIAKNQYGSFYCKNAKVDFSFSGTVKYNGKTYTVKGGKVVE